MFYAPICGIILGLWQVIQNGSGTQSILSFWAFQWNPFLLQTINAQVNVFSFFLSHVVFYLIAYGFINCTKLNVYKSVYVSLSVCQPVCHSIIPHFSFVSVFCELLIQQLSLLKQRTSDMGSSTSKYSWFLNNLASSLINYPVKIKNEKVVQQPLRHLLG